MDPLGGDSLNSSEDRFIYPFLSRNRAEGFTVGTLIDTYDNSQNIEFIRTSCSLVK